MTGSRKNLRRIESLKGGRIESEGKYLIFEMRLLCPTKSGRIQSVTLEVPLTHDQTFRGGTAMVLVPARAVCPTCRGYGELGPYKCSRCAGEGSISGEVPVSISFPPGLTKDHAVLLPLDRFGIQNLHMTVLFRPTDANNF